MTGIRRRRFLDPASGLATEDMCTEAGRRALGMAGLEPDALDFIFVGSVTPADDVPNLACTMADRLGVPTTPGFTLNAACAGFVFALATAWAFLRAGLGRTALAVSGDALSRITDYTDPKTAILFGDGAGAAVLTTEEGRGGAPGRILGPPALAAEYDRDPLYLLGAGRTPGTETYPALQMEGGPRILKQAIQTMAGVGERALEAAGRTWEDVDLVIPHQANLRITRGLERQLGLPGGRVVHTIEDYGNMSASTVGVALDETLRGQRGTVPDPALLVLTAVGGGYTSAAMVVEWRGGARG